jgi:hypothetical protein
MPLRDSSAPSIAEIEGSPNGRLLPDRTNKQNTPGENRGCFVLCGF